MWQNGYQKVTEIEKVTYPLLRAPFAARWFFDFSDFPALLLDNLVTQRAQRLKNFKISVQDWNFQATNLRLKFSIEIEGGNYQGRDWNFQAKSKTSIEIVNLKPGLKSQAYGLKNSRDLSGLNVFNRRAFWAVFTRF